MPSFTKYCLRVGCVKRLRYRNAEVVLETVPIPKFGWATHDHWVFRARRLGETEDKVCILHETRLGRYYLEQELFRQGFVVADQTPAALILDRLVRDGHALSRPARYAETKHRR